MRVNVQVKPIHLGLNSNFMIGPRGDGQLVNYGFRSPYYIVDRQFGAAELRLDGKKSDIERTDGITRGN